MIQFIATNTDGFENWTGASIDPKPLELYDINGKKLYYQFSVYKNNDIIGKIEVGADKTLGPSVQVIEFNPKPFKATEAMDKSIEIAKNNYPTGVIESTQMVVYSYPSVGAMTVVKDKTTGVKYRIFVDAYTLDEIPDKPATLTEPGVWSMYEQRLKNGVDNNLKEWQKSDQLTKSVEQEETKLGIGINTPITEENLKKLRADIVITSNTTSKTLNVPLLMTSKTLSVPLYGQQNSNYCVPARPNDFCIL